MCDDVMNAGVTLFNHQEGAVHKVLSCLLLRITWLTPLLYITILLLFSPRLTVDNIALSAVCVWGEPSPHLLYVGYLLSYPLMWARMLCPGLEWFTLTQCLLIGISLTVLAHYILQPHWQQPGWKQVAGLLFLAGFMVRSVTELYFPYVSAIGMAAALVMMLDAVRRRTYSRLWWGLFLLLVAVSVRYDSSPVLLPFACSLACLFLVTRQWKLCGVAVLAAMCVTSVYVMQPLLANVSTWEPSAQHPPQNLIEMNDVRMKFCDYADPYDAEKRSEYDAMGFSANDQERLSGFNVSLEQRSCQQWWAELGRIRTRDNTRIPHTVQEVINRLTSRRSYGALFYAPGVVAALAGVVLLLLCVPFPESWRDERVWIIAAAAGAAFMLVLSGRSNLTSVWTLSILCIGLMLAAVPHQPMTARWAYCVSLLLLMAGVVYYAGLMRPHWSVSRQDYCKPHLAEWVREECRLNPGRLYLCGDGSWLDMVVPRCSFLSAPYSECRNAMLIHHWIYILPQVHQELAARGYGSDLTYYLNPEYRYIFDKRVGLRKTTFHYYREHHGVLLHAVCEHDLDETYGIYRVEARPVATSGAIR